MQFRKVRYALYTLLAAPYVAVSNTRRSIKPADWAAMTSDKEFFYRKLTEQPPKKTNDTSWLTSFMERLYALLSSGVWKFVAWGLIIALLLFVVYWILKNNGALLFNRRNKTIESDSGITDEEDLEGTNWEQLLQQATAGNRQLAIRYAYKQLLQLLQHNQLIQYRHDKTNQEYYYELKSNDYRQAFRQLSRTCEYAWYGGYAVTPEIWQQFGDTFSHLKKRLGA